MRIRLVHAVHHDGVEHAPDAVVDLPDEVGGILVARGAATVAEEEPGAAPSQEGAPDSLLPPGDLAPVPEKGGARG